MPSTTSHPFDQQIFQQSPDFHFNDFLTPEYSSGNPLSEHSADTTPSMERFLWEQSLADPSMLQQDHDDSLADPFGHKPSLVNATSRDLQGLTSHSQELDFGVSPQLLSPQLSQPGEFLPETGISPKLLSPRLTTTPSPPEPANPTFLPNNTNGGFTNKYPTPQMSKRKQNFDSLNVQTSIRPTGGRTSSNASLNPSPTEPISRALSPVIRISSVKRGDSPARPDFRLVRTSSKRSQASRYSDHLAPNGPIHANDEVAPEEDSTSLNLVPDIDKREEQRAGYAPGQRGGDFVPSFNDLEDNRKLYEKNADVETWLATSETGSQADPDEPRVGSRVRRSPQQRLRARSTGAPVDGRGLGIFDDSHIPGPGALVDEESGDEVSDSSSSKSSSLLPESPPSKVDTNPRFSEDYSTQMDSVAPDDVPEEEPLPRQFYRRSPWQDTVRVTGLMQSQGQPATANAAMYKYDQQAAKFETASRAATWGTRRRLSESEVNSIVEGSKIRHLSLSKKGRERGASFISKLIPHRSNSTSKKKPIGTPPKETQSESIHKKRGDSISGIAPVQRMSSFSKPKSPSLSTGGAFIAMSSQLAAVGRSTSATPDIAPSGSPFQALKRSRSKSELPRTTKGKSSPGLAELMTQHGGPPMPTLASPMQKRRTLQRVLPPRTSEDEEDADEDEDEDEASERGIKMNFGIRIDNIIPTLEGFKTHARQLNPRLEPFLIERIGQEQLRRYKKLVESKVKHTQAVRVHQRCPSGKHCFELNGEATLLPPRPNAKDPETTYAQFQISGHEDSDEEDAELAEGVVTPALFPAGIPLPPVKRLPAEFECPLCFKVKKFQKPSDWTKHVHEDVQPFSCTFAHCPDPKSFKRKADWVRHENERHRHLEWWQCNIQECNHICYRKDNFVQHLVREHKMPEPKVKSRGSGSSKAKPSSGNAWQGRAPGQEVDEVWKLVDICHHDTAEKPKDEICKFCGNMCSTWKKVSVHLGKHMEQIAMPVLELVKQRDVSPDTIISPIEQSYQPTATIRPVSTGIVFNAEHNLSPYPMSAASLYQGSSGGQSPVGMHSYSSSGQMQYMQTYQGASNLPPQIAAQAQAQDMAGFGHLHGPSPDVYSPFSHMQQTQTFMSINGSTYPPTYAAVRRSPLQTGPGIPRSQPLQHIVPGMHVDTSANAMYQAEHSYPIFSSPEEAQHYMAQYGSSSQMGYDPISVTATSNPISNEGVFDPHQVGGFHRPGQTHGRGYQY